MAHAGYLQADKTLFMCVCSSSSWSWLEQISFALCNSELITLIFVGYGMVAVPLQILVGMSGFLYTLVDRLPSLLVLLKFPERAWIHQLWWFQLWILSSLQWHWCDWKTLLCVLFPKWQKCSSTNLFHRLGGVLCCLKGFCFKVLHEDIGHYGAE